MEKTGLVGNVCNAVKQPGGEKPTILHCIFHQQASVQISVIMHVVIPSHSFTYLLNNEFSSSYEFPEIDNDNQDILYSLKYSGLTEAVLEKVFSCGQK